MGQPYTEDECLMQAHTLMQLYVDMHPESNDIWLMPIGMLVVLDNILNRITTNKAKGKNTYIFIDEIYLLFQHEYSANFLFTLWKRVRKYGAFITGITQNVEDLLQSHTARTMLANSELIVMLTEFVFPSGLAEIGAEAFASCKKLISVTFADGIRTVGTSAFKDSNLIQNVNICSLEQWCTISWGDSYSNPTVYAKSLRKRHKKDRGRCILSLRKSEADDLSGNGR